MSTYRVLAFVACVLTSIVATPPGSTSKKCYKPNEIWSDCPPICPPQTCKSLNKAYSCPAMPRKCDKNTKGQCICRPGYYRNSIGECISKEDCCMKCTGKHEYYSCGGACDNICKILPYQNQTHCPIINVKCNEMCYCEKGYARNTDNVCVPFRQCEPPCGPNEDFLHQRCPQTCPGGTCEDYPKRKASCSRGPPHSSHPGKNCKNECICKEGYYRNSCGDCIPYEDCPEPVCPEGEILSKCPPEEDPCPGEFCPRSRYDPLSCPTPNKCGRPQCVCGFNQHRNRQNGKCIPTRNCPPFECDGINEIYDSCPPICPGQTCKDYLNNAKCPKYLILIVVPCKPQCRCKPDHYRDPNGICVPGKMCKLAVSLTTEPPATCNPVTTNPEDDQNALMLANDKFTASFFYAVTQEKPGQNIISSPFSVLFPLALLCLYTKGESRVELENALNLYDDDQIKSAIRALIDHIESQEQVDLALAFKLFVNELYPLSDEFLDTAKTYFDSEAENVNFGDNVKAAKIINDWVAEKTHDKIKDILPANLLSEATRLVIANCIYFLGNWTKQFDEKLTTKRDFYLDANTIAQKETMYKLDTVNYVEDEALNAQVVELPYKGNNMSLLIVLPRLIDGLPDLLEKLRDHTLIKEAYNNMSSQKVKLYIPKVEYETKIDLKKVLQRIGINKIFTNDSGITGILKDYELLVVSDALQKAFVKINERGTEAAAANVIVVGTTSVQNPTTIPVFDANHPFYFEILLGNNPLFVGTVVS